MATQKQTARPHMSEASTPAPQRRSDRAHQAILQAALELLMQDGYRALTIEGIAARAGVGKQTIYRWWPSKGAVVLEAYATYADILVPHPNTGSLRTDLQQHLEWAFESLEGKGGEILRGLMAEAQLDEAFGKEFQRVFLWARRDSLVALLQRGIERGELPPDSDPGLLADIIYGAKWYRLMSQHAPLDKAFAQQLVDLVMHL